ncbi:hypothetical protein BA895_21930 [Humibacillus sp. DSM 29435]|uniref:hypothetical protein n=1 Tax=Humibacillus sp. DSM 29435 TaxID=1869167 RepID=UPI0008723803|nr:hypothetical protein [Humibacillus sp. DSM 29435]OFE15697.1 hypothetical protein BA895_21930 [Humibacillus sp. DSM 29435]
MDERLEQAQRLYDNAVFGGDVSAPVEADRLLNAVEAELSMARGRVIHARFLAGSASTTAVPEDDGAELALFERADELFKSRGDLSGEAQSQFWIGTSHQVARHDDSSAVPALQRARALATEVDDPLTLSDALRHLGVAEHHAGRLGAARSYLEESTRLRRLLGFGPGVAANLVGLAYLAAGDGCQDEVAALLDEADDIASQSNAAGIARQIHEAREYLTH